MIPSLPTVLSDEMIDKAMTGTLTKNDIIEKVIATTPLKQISRSIDIRWEYPVIPRYNGQRSYRVQASPIAGLETEAAWQAVAEKLEKINCPKGISCNGKGKKVPAANLLNTCLKTSP